MKFVRTNKWAKLDGYRLNVIKEATLYVANYKLKPSEAKLNDYLQKTFKKDLKMASLLVIKNCRVFHNSENAAIILFPDKKDDILATLITYGTIGVPGSNILKKAFLRKD